MHVSSIRSPVDSNNYLVREIKKMATIKEKFKEWNCQIPEDIDSFVTDSLERLDSNKIQVFQDLSEYVAYLEYYDLIDFRILKYLEAKYHLNQIALYSDKISQKEKDIIFFEWLRICINPQNDPNIDFYFKKENLSKEDEIKNILFDKQDKLREIFKTNEWQIRLRKIRTWFLKRYDWKNAIKLHHNITNKSKFELLDIVFLRLQCSTLIGLIPLLFNSDAWILPLNLSWLVLIPIFFILAILVLLYFVYECSKVVGSEMNTKKIFTRVFPIFFLGLLLSFFFSSILYLMLSADLINFKGAIYKDFYLFRIIPFFAIFSLSIGIIIQLIWEEKTVTEPL